MKNERRKERKQMVRTKEEGITLIALIITIIVMLILACVTINVVVNGGLFQQAQKAAEEYRKAKINEQIVEAIAIAKIKQYETGLYNANTIATELQKSFENADIVVDNNNIVLKLENNENYLIDESGSLRRIDLIIDSVETLKSFRDNVNQGIVFTNKYIYLLTDIQLNIEEEWIPIGSWAQNAEETTISFSGTFDGGNHTINGMKIDTTRKVMGFFASIQKATIKNLIIGENNSIYSTNVAAAGLVGYLQDYSNIENCHNYANVTGTLNLGGLIGYSNGVDNKIINSSNYGKVIAGVGGGIVCTAWGELCIMNSKNYGNITTTSYSGGIIGAANGGDGVFKLLDCKNEGSISGFTRLGGIIGIFDGTNLLVERCVNNGIVSGDASTKCGGIVGELRNLTGTNNVSITFDTCTNNTSILTGAHKGNIYGYSSIMIDLINCQN